MQYYEVHMHVFWTYVSCSDSHKWASELFLRQINILSYKLDFAVSSILVPICEWQTAMYCVMIDLLNIKSVNQILQY